MSPSSFALLGMILFISLTSGVVLGYNLIKPRPKCFFTFGDPGTLHLHQHEPMLPYLPPCAVREGDAGFGSEQIVRPRDQLILEVRFDRLWPSAYLYGLGNVPWEVNIDQRMSHLTLHDHSGDALIIRFITRGGKDIFLNEAGLVLALQHIGTFRCLADGMSQALSTEIPGQIVKLPNDNASAG